MGSDKDVAKSLEQLSLDADPQVGTSTPSDADFEELLGSWPRRLLHVGTMRSHAWQPGNVYGGVKEPRYNAISYTWGRWALKENERPEVAALEVHGTPWKIPRVDPEHFRANDFRGAVQQSAWTLKAVVDENSRSLTNVEAEPVDFIWLDVACIDQRFNRESMLEIGRQAAIFRGAQSVYIWLSRTASDDLDDLSCGIRELSELAFWAIPDIVAGEKVYVAEVEGDFRPEWLDDGFQDLRSLSKDPWFTSLWTLQEAFLRKDACFLSREGDYCTYQWAIEYLNETPEAVEDRRIFNLQEVLDACRNVRASVEANLEAKAMDSGQEPDKFTPNPSILEFLEASGLNALSRNAPMELYAAAVNRKPSRILDSIYGIMQIFEFRLGESNPHAESDAVFTLADLEDELGLALMQLSPILSQAFRHVVWPRDRGKNWRVSAHSTVPGQAFTNDMPWKPEDYASDCILDVQKRGQVLWGRFAGRLCTFPTLYRAWTYSNDSDMGYNPTWMEGESDMCIVLDIAPDMFPDFESFDYSTRRGPAQYLLAQRLVHDFRDTVQVLYLGCYEPTAEKHCHFGLILLQAIDEDTEPYWRRLGVCTWEVSARGPDPVIGTRPKAEWKSGWRPVYLDPLIALQGEEEYEELRSHWENLDLRTTAWEKGSGIFG